MLISRYLLMKDYNFLFLLTLFIKLYLRENFNNRTMFSGIVEGMGTVVAIEKDQENVHFTLKCDFVNELKIDQSLSHNGVCLTVVRKENNTYTVTAIKETLLKTNLGLLQVGDKVNLERSMMMNGRLDGHIVQGHVDQTAVCDKVEEAEGSWYYTFKYEFDKEKARQGYMTVEKGSVTVNGVSLTVVNSKEDSFQVAIIPYTYEHTNFHTFKKGSVINLEFDIIGKYLSRLVSFN
jgi:riboflavin synthase